MGESPESISLSKDEFETLKTKAFDARELSYSPYSKFRVGCSILAKSGKFYQAANVENASYGACVCAERNTICQAVINKDFKFKAIGIATDMDDIIGPCGICRQFIREFGLDVLIFMFKKSGDYKKVTLRELLPYSFGPESMDPR